MSICSGMVHVWRAGCLALVLAGGAVAAASPAATANTAAAGLPDLDALMARTIARVALDRETEEQFKSRYAYLRTRVTETRDGSGKLKKRDEERFVNPVGIAGASSAGEAADVEDAARPEAKRPYRRHDFKVDSSLLSRFRFTCVGAELVEGRRVWVVDFEPASDRLPARSLKDRFINLTAGRLWIDQEEAALAKAEFRLLGAVNVAGGLVGALKRCEVWLERGRTWDGLWYPRRLVWQIEGRKFFATRRMEHRDEVTEVRPLGLTSAAVANP